MIPYWAPETGLFKSRLRPNSPSWLWTVVADRARAQWKPESWNMTALRSQNKGKQENQQKSPGIHIPFVFGVCCMLAARSVYQSSERGSRKCQVPLTHKGKSGTRTSGHPELQAWRSQDASGVRGFKEARVVYRSQDRPRSILRTLISRLSSMTVQYLGVCRIRGTQYGPKLIGRLIKGPQNTA